GEDYDLATRLRDRRVLCGSFPMSLRLPMQFDTTGRETACDLVGPITRAVRRNNDLQFGAGVIECERVFQFGCEISFFVVSRDNDANGRSKSLALDWFRADNAQHAKKQGIPNVSVSDGRRTEPKNYLHRAVSNLRDSLVMLPKIEAATH